MLRVLYFVHDLSDPAVGRRVKMLKAGGGDVVLAGFRRTAHPVADIAGIRPIDLGETGDGQFAQRLTAVARAAAKLGTALRQVERPDVIISRNLEMLALGNRARGLFGGDIPLVYECLDIHRLMLRGDLVGKGMRLAERLLGRNASLLVTSSPAFLRNYFVPFGQTAAPVALVENKVLELGPAPPVIAPVVDEGQPWRIGWFGALRCARSLTILSEFSRRMEGRVEVVLRGRPAHREFADFDGAVAAEPYVDFRGPYRYPDDLPAIYGDVHFTWAIDFFQDGQNSRWLLPNRLYEGCRHGCVPIAVEGTETARFLRERSLGFILEDVSAGALADLFGRLDGERYLQARQAVARQDRRTWVCGVEECRALVERLRGLMPTVPEAILHHAVT